MKCTSFIISIIVCISGILMLAYTNYTLTPDYLWFIYPSFGLFWYPVTVYYVKRRNFKQYAIVGCILINVFLMLTNYMFVPQHPWYMYPSVLILWWPIVMYSGTRAKTFKFALMSSIAIIFYYTSLNLLISPIHPWMIYPTFAVLWWPISIYFAKKKDAFGFSIAGSILIALFFGILNWVITPQILWSIYPIFAIGWWPMIMYYFGKKKKKRAGKSEIRK